MQCRFLNGAFDYETTKISVSLTYYPANFSMFLVVTNLGRIGFMAEINDLKTKLMGDAGDGLVYMMDRMQVKDGNPKLQDLEHAASFDIRVLLGQSSAVMAEDSLEIFHMILANQIAELCLGKHLHVHPRARDLYACLSADAISRIFLSVGISRSLLNNPTNIRTIVDSILRFILLFLK